MSALTVTIEATVEDVAFVKIARDHYKVFAEAAERHGEEKTAGIMRKQEFRAERFLTRIPIPEPTP